MEDKSLRVSFTSTLNFAWRYWSKHQYAILVVLILVALQANSFRGFDFSLEWKLVDSFTTPTRSWVTPAWICAYLAGGDVVSYVCRLWATFLWRNAVIQVLKEIVTEAFEKIQYLSTAWRISSFAGGLVFVN